MSEDLPINPTPGAVIRRAIEAVMRGVSTAEPGVIEAYDPVALTADVQPSLLRERSTPDGTIKVRAAMVTHAPVLFLGGGNGRLTFPVARGDKCLLIVASRALDQWSTLGGEVDPDDTRHHHVTDAIVLVGLTPSVSAKAARTDCTALEGSDVRLGDPATAALLALKSDLATLKTAISGAAVLANDGGATFKANILAALSGWPVGTTKVKAT